MPRAVIRSVLLVVTVGLLLPASALGQQAEERASAEASAPLGTDIQKFLAGAATGFVIHESGHLVFDAIFGANPRLEAVHFGPFPFFAIRPTHTLSSRQLFIVTSAGFWAQDLSSALVRPRHPDLRHDHAPFAKGKLAFDVLTEIGYAVVAFTESGPIQRDTRGMALGLGVSERAIGAIVLAPAALEAYRYFRPQSTWARWGMRIAEVGSVALVLKPSAKPSAVLR